MRRLVVPLALLLSPLAAPAQTPAAPVLLAEEAKPGDVARYELGLTVAGKMKVARENKLDAIAVQATATHLFSERVESVTAKGGPGKVVRHYETAKSRGLTGLDRTDRELAPERRLVVAQRAGQGTLHYSPGGPLKREELELVAEHFDTLALAGLLPGQAVAVGQTWTLSPEAAQQACLFEGLIAANLVGKLVSATEAVAVFEIAGTAEGLESGAVAKVKVTATGTFDRVAKKITGLKWEQADERAQGPASPASEVQATITLKRTVLAEEPKELSAEVRGKLPPDDAVPGVLTALLYEDAAGRYRFVYGREWVAVGRTEKHLVLRLVEKGEFVAQATVTAWAKAAPGQHTPAEEFKKLVGQLPGWQAEAVSADDAVPTDPGRWLYRLSMRGKQDGLAVSQSFYLLAGPNGDQVAVTVLARPEKAAQIGVRDLALVNAIEFMPAKAGK